MWYSKGKSTVKSTEPIPSCAVQIKQKACPLMRQQEGKWMG